LLTDAGNLKELLTVYLVFNSLKALTDHGLWIKIGNMSLWWVRRYNKIAS
jgi:hypothetical protein